MGHALAQVVFGSDSGLPEDDVVNTWHFLTGGSFTDTFVTSTHTNEITARLQDFYTEPYPTNRIQSYMSPRLNDNDATVRIYNMQDAQPRTPVAINPLTIAFTGNALPSEVALCASFQATPASGMIQARRRGRVYLGPLNEAALATGASEAPEPNFILEVVNAMEALFDSNSSCTWVVYSTVDDDWSLVSEGWVDNAWDTQRRRGIRPTTRDTWPV